MDEVSKLVAMVVSINHFQPPIENLSTCQVTRGKRLTNQTTITFLLYKTMNNHTTMMAF
jgi:hypothetical protein